MRIAAKTRIYNPEYELDATRAARWGAKDSLGNLTAKGKAAFHASGDSSRYLEEWLIFRLLPSGPIGQPNFKLRLTGHHYMTTIIQYYKVRQSDQEMKFSRNICQKPYCYDVCSERFTRTAHLLDGLDLFA